MKALDVHMFTYYTGIVEFELKSNITRAFHRWGCNTIILLSQSIKVVC